MKALVTKHYTDRLDEAVHYAGTIVELEQERFEELLGKGYVERLHEEAAEPEPEAVPGAAAPEAAPPEPEAGGAPDLETMTKKQLKAYAQEHGIKVNAKATNAAIIAEIKAAL